jgi:GMP synthase-like glutamine amidotransferase
MRIGILKTDAVRDEFVEEFGEYPDMFVDLLSAVDPQLEFATYDVEKGEYPADIDEVDAYLITGSQSSVYEDQDWIHALHRFVRHLHQRRKQIIGICFGHQIVAHALGGKTEKSDKGWGVGRHRATFSTQPDWHDGDAPEFHLLVSHQDQVVEPAPGSQVLAGSDFCEFAVCQVGEHILTFQGHPEFIPGYSENILNLRREMIGEDNYRQGMESLDQPLDRTRVAQWMINFLRRLPQP